MKTVSRMVRLRSTGCCHRNRTPASSSRQAPAASGEPDTGPSEASGVAVLDGVAEQPARTGPPGATEAAIASRREARPCRTTSTPTAETAKLAASTAIAPAGPGRADARPGESGPAIPGPDAEPERGA